MTYTKPSNFSSSNAVSVDGMGVCTCVCVKSCESDMYYAKINLVNTSSLKTNWTKFWFTRILYMLHAYKVYRLLLQQVSNCFEHPFEVSISQ